MNISISNEDIVYVYKEEWFNGFAPCFDDGIFSLACCKGSVSGKGMRQSVCKKYEELSEGQSIWIVSVAGKNINKKESINGHSVQHNPFDIDYNHNDIIYIAKINKKVSKTYTWNEYYNCFQGRRDAIYSYDNENKSISIIHNPYHTKTNMPTDCSTGVENAYFDMKQIIMSEEFYIFDAGTQCDDKINIGRGFSYKDNNGNRANILKNNLCDAVVKYGKGDKLIKK